MFIAKYCFEKDILFSRISTDSTIFLLVVLGTYMGMQDFS